MAISTETENLIKFYNQKISLDLNQISQINTVETGYTTKTGIGNSQQITVWGPNQLISNYDVPIEKLDTRIVEINDNIKNLQNLIISTSQEAVSVGCGTDIWSIGYTSITVYEDQTKYRGYTYSGQNPFQQINGTLTSSNAGIGTEDYITEVGIGTYFTPINICNNIFTCTTELCVEYANTITNLESQITILQTERDNLISKVNTLKDGRSTFQLQKYAYTRSKQKLNQQIQATESIISFLEDPANEEWL